VRIDPESSDTRKVKAYVKQHPDEFKPLLKRLKSDQFQAEIKRINHVAQKDSNGRRLGLEVYLLLNLTTHTKRPFLKFWSLSGQPYYVDFLETSRQGMMKQVKKLRLNAEADAKYIYAKIADRTAFFQQQRRRQQLQEAKYLRARPVPPSYTPAPVSRPPQARLVPPKPANVSKPRPPQARPVTPGLAPVPISRPNTPLYFAYGSNLHPLQFKERCPNAKAVLPASLEGYKVVYVGSSPINWKGAVANIKHTGNSNDIVKGFTFRLTKEDQYTLDGKEGLRLQSPKYKRSYFNIASQDRRTGELHLKPTTQTPGNGQTPQIFTYTRAIPNEMEKEPSKSYVEVIVEGLKSWSKQWSEKYPQLGWGNYIQKMSQVETNGQIVPKAEKLLGRLPL